MSHTIHQASDKYFKQSLQEIVVAKELFEQHLPVEIFNEVRWDSLKLSKETAIDNTYKAYAADVVYEAKMKGDNDMYFTLLCEHQSRIDHWMALRILNYSLHLINRHHDQHPKSSLPWVYPLVIYDGKKQWDAEKDLFVLFGEQSENVRRTWTRYQLIDLQRLEDDDLYKRFYSGLFQYVLKHKEIKKFRAYLEVVFPWLINLECCDKINYASLTLQYIVSDIEKSEDEALFTEYVDKFLSNQLRRAGMTLAENFEQNGFDKGMIRGRQEGRQEGRDEGRKEERLLLARKMLASGFDVAVVCQLTGLSEEEILLLEKV